MYYLYLFEEDSMKIIRLLTACVADKDTWKYRLVKKEKNWLRSWKDKVSGRGTK